MMQILFNYIAGLIVLMIYILVVLGIGNAILPHNILITLLYYAVTGIIWIFPAMWFIRWRWAPKNLKE